MKIMQAITAALAAAAAVSGQYMKQPDGSLYAPRNPDGSCPPLPPPTDACHTWVPAPAPTPLAPKGAQ